MHKARFQHFLKDGKYFVPFAVTGNLAQKIDGVAFKWPKRQLGDVRTGSDQGSQRLDIAGPAGLQNEFAHASGRLREQREIGQNVRHRNVGHHVVRRGRAFRRALILVRFADGFTLKLRPVRQRDLIAGFTGWPRFHAVDWRQLFLFDFTECSRW